MRQMFVVLFLALLCLTVKGQTTQEPLSANDTLEPTAIPTVRPTLVPTRVPTKVPTRVPTMVPTPEPTQVPGLLATEDTFTSPFPDEANWVCSITDDTYGYFATSNSSGLILQILLSNMTRGLSLQLNSTQGSIAACAYDGNGHGYFATASGYVVKVALSNLTVAASANFTGQVFASIVAQGNFVYVGSSAKIYKLNQSDLDTNVTPLAAANVVAAMYSDGVNLYAGVQGSSIATIYKMSLNDLEIEASLSLQSTESKPKIMVGDGEYMYVGLAMQGTSSGGRVVKIRISSFTRVTHYVGPTTEKNYAAGFIDGEYGWFAQRDNTNPGSLVQLRLSDMKRYTAYVYNTSIRFIWAMRSGVYGYFPTAAAPIYKILLYATFEPTSVPTAIPTSLPTEVPTEIPTAIPTELPTPEPTPEPTTQAPSTPEPQTPVPESAVPATPAPSSTTAAPVEIPEDEVPEETEFNGTPEPDTDAPITYAPGSCGANASVCSVAFRYLKNKQCDALNAEISQCMGVACLLDDGNALLKRAWDDAFGTGNYTGFPQETLDIMCGELVSSYDPSSFCSTQLSRQVFCAVYTGTNPLTTSAACKGTVLSFFLMPLIIGLLF